ncbi:hypothetical protein ANN_23364 [Periplaneta americana]|uniref:Uncharacterized protein n=1 Tax=Periplaneta americana TaxID=6978 RepID=A0ABQ8SLB5_PERAM|nr:hypothetical protein ANN_23364 [Periplaneta americana]
MLDIIRPEEFQHRITDAFQQKKNEPGLLERILDRLRAITELRPQWICSHSLLVVVLYTVRSPLGSWQLMELGTTVSHTRNEMLPIHNNNGGGDMSYVYRVFKKYGAKFQVVVITEDVQNVHLLLEYRPHIDVSLTCEHDPKLQEYCVCPQNIPQFDSEGIPNQAPETNKPMILNGPTSRNREGSDQVSVEAKQLGHLYLSIDQETFDPSTGEPYD